MRSSLLTLLIFGLGIQSFAQITLPANMYGDTLHAPFYYGVASADPSQEAVIIWTKIEVPQGQTSPEVVKWEMSANPNFSTFVGSGFLTAELVSDWTVQVDVTGLTSGSRYFYRFTDNFGNTSAIGQTRTLQSGSPDEVQLAVSSCASIFSGYFNAYRRISERDNLDAVILLGDYIYDTVDSDEEIRIPTPYPVDPDNLTEWRERHAYYLLDPDLRAMRQRHPIIGIWDNHDADDDDLWEPIQAFQEYVPMRLNNPSVPSEAYRTFEFGDLAELIMMDVLIHRSMDTLTSDTSFSMLGLTQYDWLTNTLDNTSATWKILGSQNMFGGWFANGVPDGLLPIDGDVFDDSTWDGFREERANLLTHLESNAIDNCVFLSGDSHISMAMNVPLDPFDEVLYDPLTGDGSIAVEFLPTSITRGNFDERGYSLELADFIAEVSMSLNPHHVFTEVVSHGYGLLTIQPDTTFAEFWYSDILEIASAESSGGELFVVSGQNKWQLVEELVSTQNTQEAHFSFGLRSENPASANVLLNLSSSDESRIDIQLVNALGKQIQVIGRYALIPNEQVEIRVDVSELPVGVYHIVGHSGGEIVSIPIEVIR